MRYTVYALLALVVLLAMFAARVQAGSPDWLVPPGTPVPPEPEPLPGDSDSGPCPSADVLSPRWFLPWVAL